MRHDREQEEDAATKARRAVRTNNFTQQTNVLDVDKHMCGWRLPFVFPSELTTRSRTYPGWHTLKKT